MILLLMLMGRAGKIRQEVFVSEEKKRRGVFRQAAVCNARNRKLRPLNVGGFLS